MPHIQLNDKQQKAVEHFEGPMVVLSVAGSGKTHVLTERIAHLIEAHQVLPTQLLAITFAKKAANEMLERLGSRLNGQSRKLTICTFHSLGYRILKETGYPATQFKVIQNGSQMEVFHLAMRKAGIQDDPNLLLNRVSMAKGSLITPQDLATTPDPEDQDLARVYREYELLKRRQRLVDYDDLLCLPYRLLHETPGLLEQYQDRYRFILVDEFQDSSRVMVELVKLLTGNHRNVWACGDDDQVIHEFRGAAPDVFVSFEKHFNGDLQMVTMDRNYRSSKNILHAANRLISHNTVRLKKKMKTDNGNGEPVQVLEVVDEHTEADVIVEQVSALKARRVKYGDMAILVRVHRLSPAIEAAFIIHGIPYSSRNGRLFERPEIKTVLGIMRFLLQDQTPKGFKAEQVILLRSDLFPGADDLSLQDALDIGSCYVLMKNQDCGLDDGQTLTKAYIEAFEQIVAEHADLNGLMKGIAATRRDEEINDGDRVQLMTIHQAKGLEFDAVIVPGVNEGILPHANALDKAGGIEEERRLMYVAMTRARRYLIITYRKRIEGQPAKPSRFIQEIQVSPKTKG